MERKKGFDFVRAVATIGIVVFHFYCHSSSAHKLFLYHANGSWGTTINYLFFALSGYLLHAKYGSQDKLDLKTFYYRRWKATMPAHLAVFLFAYSMNVFSYGTPFYLNIPRWRLLLSFIGLDGYASWVIPTYFITGEWFLGAILVAYAAYPVLKKIANYRKNWVKYTVLGIMIIAYEVILNVDFWGLPASTNPITCLLCFYAGMLGSQHPNVMQKKSTILFALVICAVVFAIPIDGESITKMILAGLAALIVLYNIGEVLCRNKVIGRVTSMVSSLSYPVFLIHHRIIIKVLEGFDTVSTIRSLGVVMFIVAAALVLAKVLDILMNTLFESQFYTKTESFFLNSRRSDIL